MQLGIGPSDGADAAGQVLEPDVAGPVVIGGDETQPEELEPPGMTAFAPQSTPADVKQHDKQLDVPNANPEQLDVANGSPKYLSCKY